MIGVERINDQIGNACPLIVAEGTSDVMANRTSRWDREIMMDPKSQQIFSSDILPLLIVDVNGAHKHSHRLGGLFYWGAIFVFVAQIKQWHQRCKKQLFSHCFNRKSKQKRFVQYVLCRSVPAPHEGHFRQNSIMRRGIWTIKLIGQFLFDKNRPTTLLFQLLMPPLTTTMQ